MTKLSSLRALAVLAGLAACSTSATDTDGTKVPRPNVISAQQWGSDPGEFRPELRHKLVRLTVHHAGVLWNPADDPWKKIVGLQGFSRREKGWPDVPYHFLVAPDGSIFEGRPLQYAGDTNTEYDPAGHALVQVWGNFEEQRIGLPQLRSTVHLLAWLSEALGIPAATIAGHKDWSQQTSCPGKDLDRYLQSGQIRQWVDTWLSGQEPVCELGPELPGGPSRWIGQ